MNNMNHDMHDEPQQPQEQAHMPSAAVFDAEASYSPDTNISRSTIMMLLMFVAGMMWIAYQSHLTPNIAPTDEDFRNEALVQHGIGMIANADGEALEAQNAVNQEVMSLYQHARQKQIPMDRLRQNPFVYQPMIDAQLEQAAQSLPRPEPRRVIPTPEPEVEQAPPSDHLILQSILRGERNSALISDYLVTVNQIVDGWTVTEIGAHHVTLRWRDQTLRLSMD